MTSGSSDLAVFAARISAVMGILPKVQFSAETSNLKALVLSSGTRLSAVDKALMAHSEREEEGWVETRVKYGWTFEIKEKYI